MNELETLLEDALNDANHIDLDIDGPPSLARRIAEQMDEGHYRAVLMGVQWTVAEADPDTGYVHLVSP